MSRRLFALALVAAMLAAACKLGPGSYRHASVPRGVTVEVRVIEGSMQGELLETGPEGLLILRPGGEGIIRFPWASLRELRVEQFDDLRTPGGAAPSEERLRSLRRLSRFPLGMTPEIESALVEAHGGSEIRTWGS